jgi:raffinose/stachyose/melibiose transport system substrate-binding protein
MRLKTVSRLAAGVVAAGALSSTIGGAAAQVIVNQWDQFANTGITAAGPAMEALIETCQGQLPNVTIIRTVAPSIGIREVYRLAVSAGKTPDLAYTWPAASVLAGYARTGVLAQLDGYAETFGWKLNDFSKGRNSYQGHLYAYPLEQDLMGVYYNRDLFKEHDVPVPTTYDEFRDAVETFKKAGITPIAFGNRDRWPATNTLSVILGATVGRAGEEEVLFGDTPWTNDGFAKAAATIAEWGTNGYFPDGFNGIGFDEANALFLSGQAAMNITGTWAIQDLGRNAKFDLGVFLLPPIGDVPPGTMWGEGSQWQISATASQETKDAAAAYLNCLVAPDKQQTWVEKGFLVPIGTSPDDIQKWETLPIVKEFYKIGLAEENQNFYDLHTTLPESVTQILYPELQRLVGGDSTPEEFLQAMQAGWEKAIANGERWTP